MNLTDLLLQYRDRADDTAQPPRNSDAVVSAWLNEAVEEACIRALLIFDIASAATIIRLVPAQATYRLSPHIHKIQTAWTEKYGDTLEGTDESVLDQQHNAPSFRSLSQARVRVTTAAPVAQWRTATGRPWAYMRDGMTLRVVPIPTDADTLHLEVYRIPFDNERMRNPQDCPAIPAEHHSGLCDWALYRAYSRRDEDQYDDKVAAKHLEMFTLRFGERESADVLRRRSERRSHATRISWP